VAVITTYTSLQTAVTDYLKRSNLATFVPNFIQNWESDFLRDPKNFGPWMETSTDATIASSVIATGTGYLGLKAAYVAGDYLPLERVSLHQMFMRYPRGGETGRPEWIAREGSNFIFGPVPDDDYSVHLVKWVRPTLLRNFASDAAAHYLITDAPDLPLFGALLQAEPYIKNDERLPLWQSMYDRALVSYRELNREEETSGSPVQEVLA
jgi:hypothetical protein